MPATAQDQIAKLTLQRKVPLNRLKEIYDYSQSGVNDQFYKQNFFSRCEYIDITFDEFQKIHNSIISLITTDAEFDNQDKIRASADKYVYAAKSKRMELESLDPPPPNTGTSNQAPSGSNARLPKMNVPVFDGNVKLWPAFFDIFKNLIHSNSSITNIEKYHYLLTSLKNEPFNLVKSIPMSDDNYQIAYDKLVKEYQNKRLLATVYFNEIYTAQALYKPSPKDLKTLLHTFSENLSALKLLGFDIEAWDFLIFNMLLSKLDDKSKTDFELEFSAIEMPTYKNLTTFLGSQCKALESVQYTKLFSSNKSKPFNYQLKNTASQQSTSFQKSHSSSSYVNTVETNQQRIGSNKCLLCPSSHALYRCSLFQAKTPHERLSLAKQNNICINCLGSQHSVRNCPSSSTCKICKFPHHTTLHLGSNKNDSNQGTPSANSSSNTTSQSTGSQLNPVTRTSAVNTLPSEGNVTQFPAAHCSSLAASVHQSTVLLSTALVDICDGHGNFQKVRALLDTASMANFISDQCINRLGLKRRRLSIPIEGVNNSSSVANKGITQCFVKPCGKDNPIFSFDAIVLPKVCSNQPRISLDTGHWDYVRSLPLADSSFYTPGPVDLLLGAELVPYMLGPGRVFGKPTQPVAMETVFGWILQGRADSSSTSVSLVSCHASVEPDVDFLLKRFWEIEQPTMTRSFLSPDDQKCETIYSDLTYRDDSGNFVVPLPFKIANPDFGDTYSQALRRFTYLESRLYKTPSVHAAYCDFIQEYLLKGYFSRVPISDYKRSDAFYMPHRCVLKPSSLSTKIRVVFDGSAKGTNGLSLNDALFPGPKLYQDLSSILLRFRVFPVAFVCDMKQMYCQVFIREEHRKFQRFLWRFSSSENIQEYTITRVSFGVSSAPYLALRTIKKLADLEKNRYPLAARILQNSVYMDDCVCGADSLDSALQVQSELVSLLKEGGFELGKWASNNPTILSAVPGANVQMPLDFQSEGPSFVKVLGLQWDPRQDIFSYTFSSIEASCTKRNILSQIARIFDPIGFLAPTVFMAKVILQQLWLTKCGWDDEPPQKIVQVWEQFKTELPQISEVRLPRLLTSEAVSRLELHAFSDASTCGYGCSIYLRITSRSGTVKVVLIAGKSRVAPLKSISLPRLELCAAYLLADLVSFLKDSFAQALTFNSIVAWSDSQVTLAWLSASPHRWKPFVANRVAHIQEIIPPSSWRYVPTLPNPSDCASRGLSPLQLLNHKLWWKGPDFLYKDHADWPKQPDILVDKIPEASQEAKVVSLQISVADSSVISTLLERFSSLQKIQNILSYVLKFCSKFKCYTASFSNKAISGKLLALQLSIKSVQKECFPDVISACEKNLLLPKPMRKLCPFLDQEGILRVGGRLRRSLLSFEAKHPIILPKSHRLTDLIIEQAHQDHLHPGFKTLQNIIVQNFWILSPRSAIYRCLSRCLKCFRSRPRSFEPIMADLPSYRITQIKAFSQVCIDFAGPFFITLGRHRGAKTSKAYICVFVCCATKAIHFELCSDLSSPTFLACLRRFISRRGRVSDIFSDQATNFKGAFRELLSFADDTAQELSINWHFNPPSTPHFNGLAEAGVKSAKTHILRVIGDQILNYEEFYTLLTQIESVLNSRPLSAISEDPADLTPLTPGHFLTMEPLSTFAEPNLDNVPLNRLSRWQLLQRMHNDFWKRWSSEYLHTLQQRSKWTKDTPNVKINTLVLIKDDQNPPLRWSLGRVVELHSGHDGVIRVVTLKTKNGFLQRPVVKICPLPGQ